MAQKQQEGRIRTDEMLFTPVGCSGTFLPPPQARISQVNHCNEKSNSCFAEALLKYAVLELLKRNGNVKSDF